MKFTFWIRILVTVCIVSSLNIIINIDAESIISEENEGGIDAGILITTTTPADDNHPPTTENEIPIFPSTTIIYNPRKKAKHHYSSIHSDELSPAALDPSQHQQNGQRKNVRLMKFLRHFRLDFSKFDSTCIKRGGRGVVAPAVSNALIFKYTRRRNRAVPRNRYGMALYECEEGYAFPPTSADRMFCSRNKWVGPRPVCLPKGTIDLESECSKCQQICNREEGPTPICSCYSGYEMVNGSCVDIDECEKNNGECFGICYNKPGSFQCFCPSGFQVGPDGKNCIDRNECLLRNGHGPCQDFCNNTIGSYTCSCEGIPGTKLAPDKHSCEDMNECDDDNFGCSHNCLNTFGNAFCSCPRGFLLSTTDYKTCLPEIQNETEDPTSIPENLIEPSIEPVPAYTEEPSSIPNTVIDCPPGSEPDTENSQICVEHEDCSVHNGGCDHICVPSGSFRFCSCRNGYELLNETTCVDLNECEQENGGCDHICVNTDGSFFCECKEGYYIGDDKRTCKVKFCDEPPSLSTTSGWDCKMPDGTYVSPGEKPSVDTSCRLRCLPGYILHVNTPPSYHHRFQYEILNDEPLEITLAKTEELVIRCNERGDWIPKMSELGMDSVSCDPSHCPKLQNPDHGTLFPELCVMEDGVPLNTQCLLLCSSGYYPKNGRIRTCSKSLRWFPEENPICLRLPPTPRPHIHCPSDLIVDLKAGQSSAHVIIPQPQANMDWYRYVEADPPWAKSLEWDVPAGITEISFTARSPVSNDTATCQFKIHIVDREAPRVQGCPTSFEIRLNPGETSKEVWWSEPKFTDNVKLHYVQQSHNPGHLLGRGTHHITYVAGDAETNKARCAFTITVHSPDEYEMADHSFYSKNIITGRQLILCPNLKTGRWNLHYAYYLPPGCRYHSQSQGINHQTTVFKQSSFQHGTKQHFPPRVSRRARGSRPRRHY